MINNKIKPLLCILLVVTLIIVSFPGKEHFSAFMRDSIDKVGHHSVVDIYGSNAYDLDYEGPKCLGTCILEHIPNINWTNPDGTDDILKFNKENPNKGYCYRANDREFPFKCENDCIDKCGVGGDSSESYNYDMDFSQCEISDKLGCIEKRVNITSGNGIQNTTGCKECIFKYKKNLDNLMKIYYDELKQNETCNAEE